MIEPRTIADLNAQLAAGTAQVRTASEYKALAQSQGIAYAAAHTHIVTTGTFEPMESCGAFVNLGHTDPPIRLQDCRLQGVSVSTGLGAVDIYIG
ncbi:MAG: homocysteine biosynthesis protein, partial [Pseudanabaenaceae cyanobacterium]